MRKFISYLIVLCCLSSLLIGCQKELSVENSTIPPAGGTGGGTTPPVTTYQLICKVDGNAASFNTNLQVTNTTAGGINALAITGFASANPGAATLNIIITGKPGQTVTTGTYTETNTANFFTTAQYNNGTALFSAGINMTPNPPFQVNITTLNATEVKGTFSGAFYGNLGLGPAKVNITEGVFAIKF